MARKHGHYFRDVSSLQEIDVYRVHDLFGVNKIDTSGALAHASKKILVAGLRGGGKDLRKDIQEAIDTLQRKLDMLNEDEIAGISDESPLPAIEPGLIQRIQETADTLAPLFRQPHNEMDEDRIDRIAGSHGDGEHYSSGETVDP